MTTVGELVEKGDIPEERKGHVKRVLHDLGYAASRAVGKAFLKITEKQMTDARMSIADANAILAEVEPLQGVSIVQDTDAEQAFCKVKVNGPLGHFCGNLLIDTGCTMGAELV